MKFKIVFYEIKHLNRGLAWKQHIQKNVEQIRSKGRHTGYIESIGT